MIGGYDNMEVQFILRCGKLLDLSLNLSLEAILFVAREGEKWLNNTALGEG